MSTVTKQRPTPPWAPELVTVAAAGVLVLWGASYLALAAFLDRTVGPLYGQLDWHTGRVIVYALVFTLLVALIATATQRITHEARAVAAVALTLVVITGVVLAYAGHQIREDLAKGEVSSGAGIAADVGGVNLTRNVLALAPRAGLPDGRYFVASDGGRVAVTPTDDYRGTSTVTLPRDLVQLKISSDSPTCQPRNISSC